MDTHAQFCFSSLSEICDLCIFLHLYLCKSKGSAKHIELSFSQNKQCDIFIAAQGGVQYKGKAHILSDDLHLHSSKKGDPNIAVLVEFSALLMFNRIPVQV